MSFASKIGAVATASLLMATAAFSDGMGIIARDAYARAATPTAKAGGVFMTLMNHSDQDDRLIAVQSDVAKRIELHTHTEHDDGVMKMTKIEGGIALPAGGMHVMKRGGDHVMLMGLNQSLTQGDTITLTLIFDQAGEVEIQVPVDNDRKAADDDHAAHSH